MISYSHYLTAMNAIVEFWQDPENERQPTQQALEACKNLSKWTDKSYKAIGFTEEYRPQIKNAMYLESLDEIENLARLHLKTFERLRPYCNASQIQMLEDIGSPGGPSMPIIGEE